MTFAFWSEALTLSPGVVQYCAKEELTSRWELVERGTAWSVSPLVVCLSFSSPPSPHPSPMQRPLDFKTDVSEFAETAWMGQASAVNSVMPNLPRRRTLQPPKWHFKSIHQF